MSFVSLSRRLRGPAVFVLILLAIELLDEFVFGAKEAAWPIIRDDLKLTYVDIGLLLSIPTIVASVIEPVLGILGDIWRRRVLILGGGVGFAVACLLVATSHNFSSMLIALVLFFPSSGAFVALSQSTLMDVDPTRHEQNMARWTFTGSLGVVIGSLVLGVSIAAGLGWRAVMLAAFVLTVVLWLMLASFPIQSGTASDEEETLGFWGGLVNAFRSLRRGEVLRWLTLLEFSNLMLDILYGYIALYFVDVVGIDAAQATFAVTVWTGVGLLGDFLLIPLLERVRGLDYLRISATVELVLFPAFLLVPGILPKIVILGVLGFFNAGWYSVLQGQLYSAMPGQSGTVLAITNVGGFFGQLLPLAIALIADHLGLGLAIWLCLLGPIALLIGLPRRSVLSAAEKQAQTPSTE